MCRMGVDVYYLIPYSFRITRNIHSGQGMFFSAQHLTDIVEGLAKIHKLEVCDAVLSGYIGSAEQGDDILAIVQKVKAANPQALYFCDPVMGHPEKGCIVAPGVAEFLCHRALAVSDVIAPNLLELETLVSRSIKTVDEAAQAARELCHKVPKIVLVKHLSRAGYRADRFEMILVTAEHSWHVSRPLVDFGEKQPVGVGDLTSGLMLVNLLKGEPLDKGLEHVAAAVYEVMIKTKEMGEYELQLVAAQDKMVNPEHKFCATQLD